MLYFPSDRNMALTHHQVEPIPTFRGLGVKLQPDHLSVGLGGPTLCSSLADDPGADPLPSAYRHIIIIILLLVVVNQ